MHIYLCLLGVSLIHFKGEKYFVSIRAIRRNVEGKAFLKGKGNRNPSSTTSVII